MEDVGLLGDVLTLLGTFFLGFVAGVIFGPVRSVISGLGRAPGRLLKGTQGVGQRMRQAFQGATSEEALDRSGLTGKLAGAVSDLLTLRARHADTSFHAGLDAFDQGEYERARSKLSEALFWDRKVELKPLHVLAHLHLGWLDEEQEAWATAKAHYERAVELDRSNLPATLRLGLMHIRLGETGQAIFQLQRALELDPSNLDTHYYLYAIYRQAHMQSESLEQLRVIKAGESTQQLVELFGRHGQDHFRMSRYSEALDDYSLALQFDPSRVSLYVDLGDLHFLQQQVHSAVEAWCRGLWAGYSEALAERVLAVAGEDVDIQSAIQLVRDCVARHPGEVRIQLVLSRLLRRAGEEEESTALLEAAVRQSPELLAAQQDLGDLYARVGQDAKACRAYRSGLRAARAQEQVYRCRLCGYVTREEQARCFKCNRWGTLERGAWMVAAARPQVPLDLVERAGALRQRLTTAWGIIAGQLPSGEK